MFTLTENEALWIEDATQALAAVGLYVEDATGDYSGIYEARPTDER